MAAVTPALEVNGLIKRYPGAPAPALAGLSLSIAPGEAFGLLGPNGAGKTTAIGIICSLLKADAGRVTAFGQNLPLRGADHRQTIALVPQELALYPTLTVRENIRYFGRAGGLGGRLLEERVAGAIRLADLDEHQDKRIDHCSGGLKRRANLAAALVHAPRVLVLDEPTVGVDAVARSQILAHLGRLRDDGMALLYTTHYLEEAQALCQRVAILDRGQVVAEGQPAELLAANPGCRTLEDLFLQRTGHAIEDAP